MRKTSVLALCLLYSLLSRAQSDNSKKESIISLRSIGAEIDGDSIKFKTIEAELYFRFQTKNVRLFPLYTTNGKIKTDSCVIVEDKKVAFKNKQ